MICAKSLSKTIVRINAIRFSTNTSNRSYIDVSQKSNATILTLNNPPVNALKYDLMKEVITTLDSVIKTKPRGVVLTSFSDKVFSGGLDIGELHKPQEKQLKEYVKALQEMYLKIYTFPVPIVAAINGHSPAGGCAISIACDYRVMVDNFTIGLNEVALGFPTPPWIICILQNTIGKRQTEIAVLLGRLYSTSEAFAIGLIDEISLDKNDCLEKALSFIKQFDNIPVDAQTMTKQITRSCDVELIKSMQEQDPIASLIMQPEIQQILGNYFMKLQKRKK